jgi:hypothetical protein
VAEFRAVVAVTVGEFTLVLRGSGDYGVPPVAPRFVVVRSQGARRRLDFCGSGSLLGVASDHSRSGLAEGEEQNCLLWGSVTFDGGDGFRRVYSVLSGVDGRRRRNIVDVCRNRSYDETIQRW